MELTMLWTAEASSLAYMVHLNQHIRKVAETIAKEEGEQAVTMAHIHEAIKRSDAEHNRNSDNAPHGTPPVN